MSAPAEETVVARGAAATVALGRALGAVLRPGDLVGLDGELGAGKTTLVRGLAAGMGLDAEEVRSPTFVLHHVYRGRGPAVLHHIDCYRLGPGADLGELDLDGLLAAGPVVVEWADYARLDGLVPVRVRLDAPSPDERRITLVGGAPERLHRAFMTMVTAT